jgi:N-terminal domain of anti-restriction factor ArdC/IrrE N-terminal-like domain
MSNDKLLEAQKALETGVASLVSTDGWKDYLTAQSRFHTYSFANVIWLLAQAAGRGVAPTRFAGYNTWRALGRQVRKGESSYKVLAPLGYKKLDEATGEEKFRLRGFKVVSTFELSQTDGEPLPEPVTRLEGSSEEVKAAYAVVEKYSTSRGLTVVREPLPGERNGEFRRLNREIAVDDSLSDFQALKTLCHETAHSILHNTVEDEARSTMEVEAESVAFVVMHALGYDSSDYSLGYVAHWSGGDLKLVQDVAVRVQRTAKIILALFEVKAEAVEEAA